MPRSLGGFPRGGRLAPEQGAEARRQEVGPALHGKVRPQPMMGGGADLLAERFRALLGAEPTVSREAAE